MSWANTERVELSYLEDPQSQLAIQDVLQLDPQADFTPLNLDSGYVNLGVSSSSFWLQLQFCTPYQEAQPGYIEFGYSGLSLVEFYNDQGDLLTQTGNSLPLETRPIINRHFSFPIEMQGCSDTYYFRVKSSNVLIFPLYVHTQNESAQQTIQNHLVNFTYYGALLVVTLYFFVFSLILKEKSFFYYSIVAALLLAAHFSGYGFARLLLWPEAIIWDQTAEMVFYCLAGAAAIAFTQEFLQTARRQPYFHRLFNLLLVLFIVLGFAMAVGPQLQWSLAWVVNLMHVTGLAAASGVLVAGWRAYRQGVSSALLFLLAWLCLWGGVAVLILTAADYLPANYATYNAIQLGSSLELLLLSLALGHRLYLQRRDKDKAMHLAAQADKDRREALEQTKEELEEAVAEKTQQLQLSLEKEQELHQQFLRLSGLVSHEFRNPLFIIFGHLELLTNRDKEPSVHLKAIHEAAIRLNELLDQWSLGKKVNTQLLDIQFKPCNLLDFVEEVHQRISDLHPERSIHKEVPNSLPASLSVHADSKLMDLAIFNLLDNACKYSPPDQPLHLGLAFTEQEAEIYVRDFGEGIASEEQERIFSDYYRTQQKDKQTPGLGLGLALVKRIVQAHRGQITVSSQPGEGSCFSIHLPRHSGD
ncbi:7TM diverse intracellular signaling domain-containing protein [Marinospirillum sp.]|uniref:sensor histidine kinase n=1 Tax=Marinospirillum sp. TaxID=2183934 RepID=UPI00384CC589